MASLDLQNVYVHQFIRVFNIHHTVFLSCSYNITGHGALNSARKDKYLAGSTQFRAQVKVAR